MPEAFGRRFLVFVDTEEEFDWSGPRRRDAVATTAIAALPAAHRRLVAAGVLPTYLVDYPVANDERSAAILRAMVDDGSGAIGAQLHPWVNPPIDEEMSSANSFAGNLPRDIEHAKLRMLSLRIQQSIGVRPTVYRAGRYGVGFNSASLLIEEGYRLDVSVRALYDYSSEGGPNFSLHPAWPWWADAGHSLLELPLSGAYVGGFRRWGRVLYPLSGSVPLLRSVLSRAHLLQRISLTPEGMTLAEAKMAIDTLVRDGTQIFSLSFHSPSIRPGHTPYVRDPDDLRVFWAWWDGVLAHFATLGIAHASSADLIAAAWS